MKEEKRATYLSKNIQNEFIGIISKKITSVIIEIFYYYFSIILDCTPDCSKPEQMTMIARYVSIDQNGDNFQTAVIINDSFLVFIPIEKSTGLELTDIFVTQLDKMSLPLQNIRGQGYDNA